MGVIKRESLITGESVSNAPVEGDVLVEQRRISCEIYSRIVGYLRPVQNWNDGKVQEFTDRVVYEETGGL